MSIFFIHVTDDQIAKAGEIRKTRDEQYGNIYQEVDTDLGWVGDLGEICFNNWLKSKGLTGFIWHLNNAAGKPDFTINDIRVDVKTVKRKVQPRMDYTAQITAKHKDSPVDELFFLSYEFQKKRLWMLGGISQKDFLSRATYYKASLYLLKIWKVTMRCDWFAILNNFPIIINYKITGFVLIICGCHLIKRFIGISSSHFWNTHFN